LESVFSQIVSTPFDVTLVDDCSSESGVVECLEKWRAREKTLSAFRRDTRCSKGLNLFFCLQNTTHKKEDVICILDGDDWFAHSSVLQTVTDAYVETGCWVTYGSYQSSNGEPDRCTQPMNPQHFSSEARGRGFRESSWVFSHLFTAKAALWDNLTTDLLYFDGVLATVVADQIINLPIAEMAGSKRIHHIEEVLVIYNKDNPIADDKIAPTDQAVVDRKNRARQAYPPIVGMPVCDFSVIIPCKGRKELLEAALKALQSETAKTDMRISITLLEHSESPEFEQFAKGTGIGWIYIPLRGEKNSPIGQFNRGLCFDMGFLKGPIANYYLFHDNDLVVPNDFWLKLRANITRGPYRALQTYSDRFVWQTSRALSEKIQSDIISLREDALLECTKNNPGAKGGSIVVERNLYIEVGGHDPHLYFGYAPEDQFFWFKLQKMEKAIGFGDEPRIPLIHLWHLPAGDLNPLLNDMHGIFNVLQTSPQEVQAAYIAAKHSQFRNYVR
jgi:hypothetical protein